MKPTAKMALTATTIPSAVSSNAIIHKSFAHGWFYHYNIHSKKARDLCRNYPSLHQYLHDVLEHCPSEPFLTGPRSSKVRSTIPVQPVMIVGHELSSLAKQGLAQSRFKSAHMNVQMWMLQHDAKTVSIETPLWLEDGEDAAIQQFLGVQGPLSGHIDALRIDDNRIWIWDYKPRAQKERYASLQTYLYALMLSHRTGIGLENFRCGYFDQDVAFVFEPRREFLQHPQALPIAVPLPVVPAAGSSR